MARDSQYLIAALMLTVLLISGVFSMLSQVKAATTNSANSAAQISNLINNNSSSANNAQMSNLTNNNASSANNAISPTALPPDPWPGETVQRTSPTNAVLMPPTTPIDSSQSLNGATPDNIDNVSPSRRCRQREVFL